MTKDPDKFSEKEAAARFEAALKSALNTPHKPLRISLIVSGDFTRW